jgi:SulP family sulfate permease
VNRASLEANLPRLVLALRDYSWPTFRSDLIAGVTVGLVALPLAMAFAISSGVPPESGLYTAIVAGFLGSALGGSNLQVSGPTGAFVVVVYGIVAQHGMAGLFMCTMMAGVLLVLMGVTGLGSAVKFLPRSVMVGFTNGIALLIASTQVKDFFGLKVEHVSGVFVPRLIQLAHGFRTLSLEATLVASAALLIVIGCQAFFRRVPGAILALIAGTIAAWMLNLPIETIGTRFGGIPSGLPHLAIPQFRPEMVHPLFQPALTVAMLCAIESLMSASVADQMTGDRHNPNVELVAQGVANLAAPLVGGMPATGAIARTATSIRCGAKTPVAGIVHALTLLAIVLVAAPLVSHVPLAVLSAILFVVAYNMGEWREIPQILKLSRADIAVWLVTFALTVFADLSVAVETGMILAALLFIRKVAATTTITEITDEDVEAGRIHILQDKQVPDYAAVFRIHGPFLFGSVDKLSAITDHLDRLPSIVILRLRNMTALDGTGLAAFEDLADTLHASGRTLILCGAREQPAKLMHQARFAEHVGPANICDNVQHALDRARAVHEAAAR